MKGPSSTSNDELAVDRLESLVTCMKIVGREKRFLVAGDEDGAVRIWDDK